MRKVDPERQQAKRRQIMEAAGECFSRRGFHATTTAEICAAAGMSPGNLFHYFDSKSAIVEAIVDEERSDTAAYFAALEDAPDHFEALLDFLDVVMAFAADKAYARLALEIAAEAMRNPAIGARTAAGDAETRAAIAKLLRGAMARGQVDAGLDPEQAASWVAALIDGVFSRLAMDASFDPQREAPMLRLVVSRFLKPGSAA
ncbi:TetR/AcrR family transcriptional regulator [Variovorax sp. PAMC26660]|uniref:TetR/AcrR family transcriptional regulator n=1 Tax=Variovorax sp. PAMC26660 TaxID=2762322 RepID=UPI00164DB4C6|nr:TetR/AcrR family transcriptional regulator [Variovorax sp. PAMC26660]QNK68260.1 TetR/AcrR family transcriptional regulator [Variovorax sp. PAMC26660]